MGWFRKRRRTARKSHHRLGVMLRYISEAVSLEMESQLCLPARYTFIEVMKLTVSSAESASRATSARVFAPRHGTPCPVPMD